MFLNSGRSYAALPDFARDKDFGLDGLVCGNGSYIVHGGEVIFRVRIPDEVLRAIVPLYEDNETWCVFEGETANYALRYGPSNNIEIHSARELLTVYAPVLITKLTGGGVADENAHKVLEQWFWICQQKSYYEAMIKGCSKASGIDRVIALLGVPLENAVAIGDSGNDADMLRHAGRGVAMGNATQAALDAADEITADCRNGGVAEAIYKYIE